MKGMITGRTADGLQYGIKRSNSPVAYCALSISCGTRDEEGYHDGIAHFVEHTIFKGTEKKSSTTINSYLDKLGGELNAYTTKEEIVFHATVLKEDLRKAASLLFELATSATFPAEEIQIEKGVVIDEIASYKDTPSDDIYDRFEEMLFEGHPLSGQILGTPTSVRKITSAELKRFTQEKFIPCRMAFTVVADFDERKLEKDILKLVEKYLPSTGEQGLSWEKDPACRRTPQLPKPQVFDRTIRQKNHQVNCIIGNLAPSLYEEEERMAAILMSNILGGPAANSVLNSVLREKNGWVYGVECNYTQYSDTGIMVIWLGCDKENLEPCMKFIRKELKKMMDTPLSERKLKAAKKQLLGQLAISSDNGETQCLSMGKSLLSYAHIADDDSIRKKIEAITAVQIQEVCRKVFNPETTSRLILE